MSEAFLSISFKETVCRSVAAERRGSALVLTICRPEAGNSIDTPTVVALSTSLEAARQESALRAIIIAGQGGKFFCSGGDLKAYRSLETKEQLALAFGKVRMLLDQFEAFPLPIIAAVDGYALGGGMEMALACDLRFASPGAKLGMPQGRLGIIPGWNGIQRLVELVGRGTALRLLYSGDAPPLDQAVAMGLVDEVSEPGCSAVEHAIAFVERISRTAPLSLSAIKSVTLAAVRNSPAEAERAAAAEFERLWFTKDHREAEKAFAEKRQPVFVGH
jgi:enoyl-CoA hydratase